MANEVARTLRRTMTRQDVKLWVKLRDLRAIGRHHRARDQIRDTTLRDLGYAVLRFGNYEVDREFDGVLEAIRLALEARPYPAAASRRPPSPGGEG